MCSGCEVYSIKTHGLTRSDCNIYKDWARTLIGGCSVCNVITGIPEEWPFISYVPYSCPGFCRGNLTVNHCVPVMTLR